MKKRIVSENGNYVLTLKDRVTFAILKNVCVELSVAELKSIAREAQSFQNSKSYRKHGGVFFRHLSPDVSFMFTGLKGRKP